MASATIQNSRLLRRTCQTAAELYGDYLGQRQISVGLNPGESAYWSVPRSNTEWRLPRDSSITPASGQTLLLPMRAAWYKQNAYLAVMPQPIIMHQKVSAELERLALRLFKHYPEENSLARREHNVPFMIGRFDAVVDLAGNIQICELDDVCSLWPALPEANPIAASYI